uniref:TAF4A RNA polymerase II, TATA box binding protein (TBP)-associated factor n=1 Tax=Neolamprologus brichardi TaxID=32507 RepID=A0A3Q4N8Q4_NEOBR
MNSHNSGNAATLRGTIVTSGTGSSSSAAISVTAVNSGPVLSKGLAGVTMPPSSNSVIQTPLMNSQSVVASAQPVSQATGPTVTLVRTPMQTAGSGAILNGNNSASPSVAASASSQTGIGMQTPLVNNGQPSSSVAISAGTHIIKAEPPTTITETTPQPTVTPGAVTVPRTSAAAAAATGGIRALAPQMLAPRLPQATPGQPSIHNIQLPPETIENVKKCKNFLSTLIKLASSGKQSTETAATVRELVKDLLEGKLEAEEFTSRLYKELNSSPQPYLVPFLKRSLPALRQLTPDSAAFIQQSQLAQPASGSVSSTSTTPTTVVLGSPAPRLPTPVSRPLLQPGINKPGQMPSLQQRAILRPQVTLPTTPVMTLRNQAPSHIVLGQQQVQLKELQPPLRPEGPPGSKQVLVAALTPAQKNKLKEAGGTFDDDDINDVASMAGVNLSEESANILATNSITVGAVTHSCKDEAFLSCAVLQRKMLEIRRYGVTELGPEVVNYVSHAAQQHLQNLLEKVSQVAQQKNITFKQEDNNYEQSSDVRTQLKFFEQLDQLEKQRKEEQEREILLKAAK